MSQANQMVGHRSELLARVALTRRLNIDVFNMDVGGEMGITSSARSATRP